MFIRKTKTRNAATGEDYTTFRLVVSERAGKQVRQRTLLNLGRYFSLPNDQWPVLCSRMEVLLSGQKELVPPVVPSAVESLAQRYVARLVSAGTSVSDSKKVEESDGLVDARDYQEVDVASLALVRPRSVGVEHVGLAALSWLGLPEILEDVGFNGIQRNCALSSIIGRMACPGSELSTLRWLQERSALGELLDVDFEGVFLMRLYRVSDLLVSRRDEIERRLFSRISDLFSLPATVTLYDLTNTYFEGEMAGNGKAKCGHSKEKRSDCPLVTLGLVLDGSGFVRRSRMFEGSVSEAYTLEEMLKGLDAPEGAMVIMDRGIATQANIDWLVERHYRYLVVSREQRRFFDVSQAIETTTAGKEAIKIQRVVSEDNSEVRLYCYSEKRSEKEQAMSRRFSERFEEGLAKLAAGLEKPRTNKNYDKFMERIGRLKEKSHGIARHYTITVTSDESGAKATSLTWEKKPIDGTQLTHPGVYCLRTNELAWDEARLWQTYTMLTDLEAVFRCLKSELGLRPVSHHKEHRAEGHLFITVLACQVVQAVRNKLKAKELAISWSSLKEILSVQQRVTATFNQRDGKTLHVRKATVAEPKLKVLYASWGSLHHREEQRNWSADEKNKNVVPLGLFCCCNVV